MEQNKPRLVNLAWDWDTGEIDIPPGWQLFQVDEVSAATNRVWCVITKIPVVKT